MSWGFSVINTSCMSTFEKPRFLVIGSKGTFSKYGVDPQEAALKSGDIDSAVEDPELYGTFKSVVSLAYLLEIDQ
jgi:scyllo-inositol 2-dehydrogenase (NADP+)